MHNVIDERALMLLSKKIAAQSGDIRVAFDIMKTALQKTIGKVNDLSDEDLQIPMGDGSREAEK